MNARSEILIALNSDPEEGPRRLSKPAPGEPTALNPDPWEALGRELNSLGARFILAQNREKAKSALAELMREEGYASVAAWSHPLLDAVGLGEAASELGALLIRPADPNFVQEAALADLGVTAADALLLESGSVILHSAPDAPLSASLLPPVHLVVAGPGQIMDDVLALPSLMRKIAAQEGGMPRAFHAISGPSATADIEEIKVMGAHGPTKLIVLAVQSY
jgi:L-lactate dehydrogenase complex protein LldG